MKNIHRAALEASEVYGSNGSNVVGANIAGFQKGAKAMQAYGIV